jgi:hypothetical protein
VQRLANLISLLVLCTIIVSSAGMIIETLPTSRVPVLECEGSQILEFVEPATPGQKGRWVWADACRNAPGSNATHSARTCECDSEPKELFGYIETVTVRARVRARSRPICRTFVCQVCLFTIEYLSRFLTVHAVRRSTVPIGPQVGLSLMPVEGTTDALSWSACFKRVIRFTVDVYVCRCSALGTLWYPQYHRLPQAGLPAGSTCLVERARFPSLSCRSPFRVVAATIGAQRCCAHRNGI